MPGLAHSATTRESSVDEIRAANASESREDVQRVNASWKGGALALALALKFFK